MSVISISVEASVPKIFEVLDVAERCGPRIYGLFWGLETILRAYMMQIEVGGYYQSTTEEIAGRND